jgi:predicted GH43/DUF377 family glycosyl hydrolase
MDFYEKYRNIKVRLAPFRLKRDFETVKTVASIDALADRADIIERGNKPGRILGCPPGLDIDNLMIRAFKHLEILERGEFPLKGMFTEPAISLSDHSFIEKDGKMHMFYNRGFIGYDWPERCVDTIGHAISDNLIDWTVLSPAVSISQGGIDCYSCWSPAVVFFENKYWMFYTGVNQYIAQATCLAFSDNLDTFIKYGKNPVYIPGKWCPWNENKWSDCRDVYIMRDEDKFFMYFCTSRILPDGSQHNAIGVASSKNLIDWKDENQFSFEECGHMAESPFVFKHEKKYYLFYTNCGKGTTYAVSDNPIDGFVSMGLVLGDEHHEGDTAHVPSCSEVFEFKGKWYISYAERLPGNEQYLQILEFFWNKDGSFYLGKAVK